MVDCLAYGTVSTSSQPGVSSGGLNEAEAAVYEEVWIYLSCLINFIFLIHGARFCLDYF